VTGKPLPKIDIVNMRAEVLGGNPGALSGLLKQKLTECIEGGNQAILFLNRRGYSAYLMCRACGYVAKCTDCDVSLVYHGHQNLGQALGNSLDGDLPTQASVDAHGRRRNFALASKQNCSWYHRDEGILKCHYCGNRFGAPSTCIECKSEHIKHGSLGTQRLVAELNKLFPTAGVLRMDNDTTQTKDAHLEILGRFGRGEAQILVGTQMVAKGHDFPDVTLVGIVDADLSLYVSDYRSTERTFQLITQAAGRAGRDQKPGSVVLQTHTPNHYVYKFAVTNNYADFFEKECNLREITKYPPFSTILRVLVSCEDETDAAAATKVVYEGAKELKVKHKDTFAYLGVMRAPVKRIQNKYRYQTLMRLVGENTDAVIAEVFKLADSVKGSKATVFVEINPSNLS